VKKFYTLLFLLLSIKGFAAPPTIPASNLSFPQIDGGFFNVAWTAGNGTRRIIIAKAGSAVTFRPQNGVDYAENTRFGNGQQVAPGEYVVYDNAFTSFFLENLTPGTQYHFAIFEYNGTGGAIEYLTSPFLAGTGTTSGIPATQTSNAVFSNITTNSVTVAWTSGSGSRRLVVVREAAPVNGEPVNSQPYNVNSVFGSGATVAPGNYTVYNSSGVATVVTNLKPGTQYFFAFFEFNGSGQPQYKTPAYTTSVTTRSIPTTASTNVAVSKVDGKELTLAWTSGNGQRRIIVAKQGSDITGTPSNGTDYAANSVFGTGPTIAPGEFVVYDDNFTSGTISGLNPNTTYFFKIFEYDGTGTGTTYLTTSFGAINGKTATTPTVQSSGVAATNVTGISLSLVWTSGNGRARLVIARKDAAVNVTPQDFTTYANNQNLGNGNFVVGTTTENFMGVGNLQPNSTYHFAVFEYNGFNQPLYVANAATFSVTTAATLPVKLTQWEANAFNDGVRLKWSTSAEVNASHFIVERSNDGARFVQVTSVAADGNTQVQTNYTAEDKHPLQGRSFYRLKMIDMDGKFEYSTIKPVVISSKPSVFLVRNPVHQSLELINTFNEPLEFKIVNVNGQVVKQAVAQTGRGVTDVSELKAGAYYIQFPAQYQRMTICFIKQ
jgi:hypothetical protein